MNRFNRPSPSIYTSHMFLAVVFIYTSPGFKSTIKERMLYASCKEPLIGVVEQHIGIDITKKVGLHLIMPICTCGT